MQTLDTDELAGLWTRLLPNETRPDESQFQLWLALHEPNVVRAAITQLALKYRKLGGRMDRDYMVRFASSVSNRIGREVRTQTAN